MQIAHNDGRQLDSKIASADVQSRVLKEGFPAPEREVFCFPCLNPPKIKEVVNMAASNLLYHCQIPVESMS